MAGDRRRWWILGLGMAAQAASCVFLYGLPYLVPDLRHQLGLSLTGASTLAATPLIGVIVALGARWGCRTPARIWPRRPRRRCWLSSSG